MPERVSGGQAVQSSTPKQPDISAVQEQHLQTLEQAISFFEKQDPEGFFGAPVTEDVAPNYFNVIKHPMSFQRMRHKLRALEYRTFAAFVEDFELVGNNAMRYNQKRSRVHRSAVNLLRHGKKHLNTVQLEATRAIHMLHPEGPVAAAQEEAAVNRATNAATLAPSTSNLSKLLPSLSMQHSSKQLQRGVSGLDMSVPMALQDLQADYFSEEDPAYSSFSGVQSRSYLCCITLVECTRTAAASTRVCLAGSMRYCISRIDQPRCLVSVFSMRIAFSLLCYMLKYAAQPAPITCSHFVIRSLQMFCTPLCRHTSLHPDAIA